MGNFDYEAHPRDVEKLLDRYGDVERIDMKMGARRQSWSPLAVPCRGFVGRVCALAAMQGRARSYLHFRFTDGDDLDNMSSTAVQPIRNNPDNDALYRRTSALGATVLPCHSTSLRSTTESFLTTCPTHSTICQRPLWS